MNDEAKSKFSFLTDQLQKLAYCATSPMTMPLAKAMVAKLEVEAESIFNGITADISLNRAEQAKDRMRKVGPDRWKELHTRTMRPVRNMDAEMAWMINFGARLTCGDCQRSLATFMRQNAPDFSSVDAYFEWTWKLHNFVNEKLGKPIMSLADARALWKIPSA